MQPEIFLDFFRAVLRGCAVAQMHRYLHGFDPENPDACDPALRVVEILDGYTLPPSGGFIHSNESGSSDADIWPDLFFVKDDDIWVKPINQKLEAPPDLLAFDEKPWQPDVPDSRQLTTYSRVLVGLARSQFNTVTPFLHGDSVVFTQIILNGQIQFAQISPGSSRMNQGRPAKGLSESQQPRTGSRLTAQLYS